MGNAASIHSSQRAAVPEQTTQTSAAQSALVSESPPRKKQRLQFSNVSVVDLEPQQDPAPLLSSTSSFTFAQQPAVQHHPASGRPINHSDVLAASPPGMPLLMLTQFNIMLKRLGLLPTITHPSREEGRASAAIVVRLTGSLNAPGEIVYQTVTPSNYASIKNAREAACANVITFLLSEEAKSRVGIARYKDLENYMKSAVDELYSQVKEGVQKKADEQANRELRLSRKRSHLEMELAELRLDSIRAAPILGSDIPRGNHTGEGPDACLSFSGRPGMVTRSTVNAIQRPAIQEHYAQEPGRCHTIGPDGEVDIGQEMQSAEIAINPISQPPFTKPYRVQPRSWNQHSSQAADIFSGVHPSREMKINEAPAHQPPEPLFTQPCRVQPMSLNQPCVQGVNSAPTTLQWQQIPGLPPLALPSVISELAGNTHSPLAFLETPTFARRNGPGKGANAIPVNAVKAEEKKRTKQGNKCVDEPSLPLAEQIRNLKGQGWPASKRLAAASTLLGLDLPQYHCVLSQQHTDMWKVTCHYSLDSKNNQPMWGRQTNSCRKTKRRAMEKAARDFMPILEIFAAGRDQNKL